MKKIILLGILVGVIFGISFLFFNNEKKIEENQTKTGYLSSKEVEVKLYDDSYQEVKKMYRGSKVKVYEKKVKEKNRDQEYVRILIDQKEYLVNKENVVANYQESVKETEKFVRTSATVYQSEQNSAILGLVKKGEKVEIIGFDQLMNGVAHKYKVAYNGGEGFVYSKYLVDTKEEAVKNYDEEKTYQVHFERKNTQGGGDAGSLDFYPYKKADFKENKMPEEVRSLYLNASAIKEVDAYIELAKKSNINAFVVDIKDAVPAYQSEVLKKYSKTGYEHAVSKFEDYKNAILKLKENGFYVIGRITTFKDSNYVKDHPESAITSSRAGNPYLHNGSYWPSAYDRSVWEFHVELAKEAVEKIGFQEIQFDYVRFPDRTYRLEQAGEIDLKNKYHETKAQAIQTFLMYACDEIHEVGAYVSADVFGEAAHPYVTGYGQYWGAISNVVDVISAMPYPDHFGAYEYGISEIVWTVPYQLLYTWGSNYASKRQSEIPSPAKVRTWIQAYNTVRSPYIVYDSQKVSEEIKALYDAGLTGGYMTWNASSSLLKYREIASAFLKEY